MELSATELRIGNLVGIASSLNFSIGKVTLISNNRILLDNKISNKNHKFIPIELTEEWLLRFGFEKDNELNFVKFSFKVHFWSNYNSYMYGWIGGNIEIKYVHQLQNIYFALTGQELILNEKL